MRIPKLTTQFRKDVKLAQRRGKYLRQLKRILSALIDGEMLDVRYRDHLLKGEYKNRRECHIESDWLLIYKIDTESIIFERTGTHSDLFE